MMIAAGFLFYSTAYPINGLDKDLALDDNEKAETSDQFPEKLFMFVVPNVNDDNALKGLLQLFVTWLEKTNFHKDSNVYNAA